MSEAIGAIVVALIAALGGWASQRAASRASRINTSVSGRLEAEQGAYERARAFDVETIERQNVEIATLRVLVDKLREERDKLKARLRRIERLFPEWERLLSERINEQTDDQE